MKASFLAVVLLGLLLLGTPDLRAQVYGPYYNPYWDVQYQQYLQWQQYLAYLQQYDPYYELHVMHYQLYLEPYNPYQTYSPCCYAFGTPAGSTFGRVPHWFRSRAPQAIRRR